MDAEIIDPPVYDDWCCICRRRFDPNCIECINCQKDKSKREAALESIKHRRPPTCQKGSLSNESYRRIT